MIVIHSLLAPPWAHVWITSAVLLRMGLSCYSHSWRYKDECWSDNREKQRILGGVGGVSGVGGVVGGVRRGKVSGVGSPTPHTGEYPNLPGNITSHLGIPLCPRPDPEPPNGPTRSQIKPQVRGDYAERTWE